MFRYFFKKSTKNFPCLKIDLLVIFSFVLVSIVIVAAAADDDDDDVLHRFDSSK